MIPDLDEFYREEFGLVAGLDEAGRGPLAGPVVAAAVILEEPIEGVVDSKLLSPSEREELFEIIMDRARVGIGLATPEEIDVLNILRATSLAMERAIENLGLEPNYVIIDGRNLKVSTPGTCIVKGDRKSSSIAAASIVAKVVRDRLMISYSKIYEGYGFERHKGYPTREHINVIGRLGPTPFHRLTFSKVVERLDLRTLERWIEKGLISERRYERIMEKRRKLGL